jgi:hypothetical protein
MKLINKVHEPIKYLLDTMTVPLPGRRVQPGDAWASARQVKVGGLGDVQTGRLELTYTYLGVRAGVRGADEAILSIEGVLRSLAGKAPGGKATGTAAVDLATGLVTRCHLRLSTDAELTVGADGRPQKTQVLHVQTADPRLPP